MRSKQEIINDIKKLIVKSDIDYSENIELYPDFVNLFATFIYNYHNDEYSSAYYDPHEKDFLKKLEDGYIEKRFQIFSGEHAWVDLDGNIILVQDCFHDTVAEYALEKSVFTVENSYARISGGHYFDKYDLRENVDHCLKYVETEFKTPHMKIAVTKHLRKYFNNVVDKVES